MEDVPSSRAVGSSSRIPREPRGDFASRSGFVGCGTGDGDSHGDLATPGADVQRRDSPALSWLKAATFSKMRNGRRNRPARREPPPYNEGRTQKRAGTRCSFGMRVVDGTCVGIAGWVGSEILRSADVIGRRESMAARRSRSRSVRFRFATPCRDRCDWSVIAGNSEETDGERLADRLSGA